MTTNLELTTDILVPTTDLELTTDILVPTLYLEHVPGPSLLAAATEGTSWNVSTARGRIQGVGVSVSGLGAYARANGSMNFSTKTLESSKTYKEMRKSYKFSAGLRGFWSWIGLGNNASYHKQELTKVFNELSNVSRTNGRINIDLMVTGLFPNVPVSASAYIQAFSVSSKTDSRINFSVISTDAANQDTGAQDQNGQNLPVQDNNSTIDI
ncbi:MAG: hypothetical protein F6K50_48365 [Moorea sp. SIO3I7]|uniref:hypothetical protein n=1 Tax=unclassified Moorena TaxID=2683338 RepID=UPI0013CC7CD2|nr:MULTISPECIES: hypothetical protein [unclassified Moorena]NEO02868.1 hypothetical protein [Moorena sp. SIO3I7]NEO22112.1 hypothetical protein [Moorena sp. SIO4A5]NEO43351.1 hypothetical protein [Moorena sp. SIO4A3]NEP24304.1 hypothetical protein [Moorena sp. SIO3I6]